MDWLKGALSVIVYAAMLGVCVLEFQYAGMGGFAGAVVGFLARALWPGQSTLGERLGNGYVGSLTGLCVGFAAFGIGELVWDRLADMGAAASELSASQSRP